MGANDKKERVIHTRVSDALDDEIKRRATGLGVSVSNLVRNILQHTFGLVEDIVHDSAEIARSARDAKAAFSRNAPVGGQSAAADQPRVIGWQQAVLNVNAVCEGCNVLLPKGTRAGLGILDGPGAVPIRCLRCVEELVHDDERIQSDD